jgi:uncharacterized membrane protein (DUF2068 family)
MPPKKDHHVAVLRIIAAFKLFKSALLFLLGLGVHKIIHQDAQEFVRKIIVHIHGDPNGHYFRLVLSKISNISPAKLKMLGIAAFSYSAMFFVEGVGLAMAARWAEWMAVFTTGFFIPLEIYETTREFHWLRLVVSVANVAIVVYLIREIRRHRPTRASEL